MITKLLPNGRGTVRSIVSRCQLPRAAPDVPWEAETGANAVTRSSNSLSVAILSKIRPRNAFLLRFCPKPGRATLFCLGFVQNRVAQGLFALVLSKIRPHNACGPRFCPRPGPKTPVCRVFGPDREKTRSLAAGGTVTLHRAASNWESSSGKAPLDASRPPPPCQPKSTPRKIFAPLPKPKTTGNSPPPTHASSSNDSPRH